MVNTSLVLCFEPETDEDCQKLMSYYEMFQKVVPLSYPLTPHITLAYFNAAFDSFDENGNFQRKESYTECLLHYIAHMDLSSGLYPLTQDLMFIFRQYGEYAGWWDLDGQTNLFVGDDGKSIPGVNAEIAWLFLCCYSRN